MSFYSVHLAWQQRVAYEQRDNTANFERVFAGKTMNKNEESMKTMYSYLFNPNNTTKNSYVPKSSNQSVKSHGSGRLKSAIKLANKDNEMRAYLPNEYYRRVGYEQLQNNSIVTSNKRLTAFERKTSDRFNEAITYEDVPRRTIKLTPSLLQNQENTSSKSVFSRAHSRAKSSTKRTRDDLISLNKARQIIENVLGKEEEEQKVEEKKEVVEEEIEPIVGQSIDYLMLLEAQLKEEREKREALEREIIEVQKLSSELAQKVAAN